MLKFALVLFHYVKKRPHTESMVIFKIYDVTDCAEIITVHILHNTSRIKQNQAMKFGQLIKYDVEVHFFK